jgi:NitT/TauT family transport system ATP-binding protein
MMIVSHDLEDAVFLADKILLLTRRPARIAEYLTFNMVKPRSPESVSEAEFIKTKALALEIFQREIRA